MKLSRLIKGFACNLLGSAFVIPLLLQSGLSPALGQTSYEPYLFTTFAGGTGIPGSADGTAAAARFRGPVALAADTAGNVFVADNRDHTIRKVAPAGLVTTVAGSPGAAGSADGLGGQARFQFPQGVAVDRVGTLFVADRGNHTIRKMTAAGVVTTLAGSPGLSGSANGTGSAARFNAPSGVAVDTAGNVFVTDANNHTIRKVTAAGVVTTLAGSPGNHGTANGTGSAARFYYPNALALDSAGNLFVADWNNNTIRKVTAAGVVTTLAGLAGSYGTADGSAAEARFQGPVSLAVDTAGNVFVADNSNHTIRKVTAAGVVTTLAGSPGDSGSADGTGSAARFYGPQGVAVDRDGNLFVADYDNYTIRKGLLASRRHYFIFQKTDGSLAQWNLTDTNLVPALSGSLNPAKVDPAWQVVGYEDMNADGQPDVLFQHNTGFLGTWFMNGSQATSFSYLDPPWMPADWKVCAVADLNHDGGRDWIYRHKDGWLGVNYMYGVDRLYPFSFFTPTSLDPAWRMAAVADFSGDGEPDLLLHHTEGWLGVFTLNGTTVTGFSYLSPAHLDPAWRLVGLADLNNDGKPDLVMQHTQGFLGVFFLNGMTVTSFSYLNPAWIDPAWKIKAVR